MRGIDERAHPCIFQKWVSKFYLLSLLHDLFCKFISNVLLHKDSSAITADLKEARDINLYMGFKKTGKKKI